MLLCVIPVVTVHIFFNFIFWLSLHLHPPLEVLPVCVVVQILLIAASSFTHVSLENDLCYHLLMASAECLQAKLKWSRRETTHVVWIHIYNCSKQTQAQRPGWLTQLYHKTVAETPGWLVDCPFTVTLHALAYVYLHMISNFHTCLFSFTVHVKGQDAPHKWQQCIITEGNNQLGPHRRSTKSIFFKHKHTQVLLFYCFMFKMGLL